jgi:hypothetical protein
MAEATYYERSYGRGEERRSSSTRDRWRGTGVHAIALAVAACGAAGYLIYVGATAPELRELPPDVVEIQPREPLRALAPVRIELGLTVPERPNQSALD